MKVKLDTVGMWKGRVYVKVDLWPETTDKTYGKCYVQLYDKDDNPLGIWQHVPCFSKTFPIDKGMKVVDFITYMTSFFDSSTVQALDDALANGKDWKALMKAQNTKAIRPGPAAGVNLTTVKAELSKMGEVKVGN